jgi:REP element-mobilizing transposase RayT
MRRLRFIPEGGALIEVTCRTLQSRFLLRPNPAVNDLVVGVLGQAQRMYPIRVYAYAFVSNHFHLLLDVDDALQLASFMRYLNSNLARKIGRLVLWRDKIWARKYQAIVVSSEEAAQVERFRYVLAHGIKEGLVGRVTDWPGVHCAQALLTGETVQGYWCDETQAYAARRRGEEFDRMRFAMLETLTPSPLPCWKHLSEEKTAEARRQSDRRDRSRSSGPPPARGTRYWGRLLSADSTLRSSRKVEETPAPLFHAASKAVRRELYEMYGWFVAAFRESSEKLRAGNWMVKFPAGSFPPALPFVAV